MYYNTESWLSSDENNRPDTSLGKNTLFVSPLKAITSVCYKGGQRSRNRPYSDRLCQVKLGYTYMQYSGTYPWTNIEHIPASLCVFVFRPSLRTVWDRAKRRAESERVAEIASSGGREIHHSYIAKSHIGF